MSQQIADRLGLGNQVYKLRIGDSFKKKEGNGSYFHTIRYDFKPASMDPTKAATMDVGEANQVTVTVPHIEGAGCSQTVFKGSKKPYTKECVLIIDRTTGEIVLEKLAFNMQLKKTRAEGSSRMHPRPITPVDPSPGRFNSPSSQKLSLSPAPVSPTQSSPPNILQRSPCHQRSSPSRPGLNAASTRKPPLNVPPHRGGPPPPARSHTQAEVPSIGVLSDSSGSDFSDGEPDSKTPCPKPSNAAKPATPPVNNRMLTPAAQFPSSSYASSSQYSQLDDDLKLSESESDSD